MKPQTLPIAAVMVLAGQAESTASRVAVHVAILGIGASAFLILRSAAVVGKLLGTTGIRVIGRLMGLILAAIAIQFVIDGGKTKGNKIMVNKFNDCRFRVRDRVHPFASDSVGVEEIDKDQLVFLFRLFQPFFE